MAEHPTDPSPPPEGPPAGPPRPTGRPVYESTLLPPRRRRRFPPWVVVPGLLALLLAAFYFLLFGPKPRRAVPTAGMVAYASDSGSPGVTHLWIAAADGSAARRLSSGPSADSSPAWTADGDQIAFLSDRADRPGRGSGQNQVWLMDGDGRNAVQVTRTGGAKSQPAFAPGSNALLGFLSGGSLAVTDAGRGDASVLLPAPGTAGRPDSTDPNVSQQAPSTVAAFAWKPSASGSDSGSAAPGLAAVLETSGVQTLAVLPGLSAAPRLTQTDQPGSPPLAAADALSLAWAPDGSKMALGMLHVQGLPRGQKASALVQFDGAGDVQKPLIPLLPDPSVGPQNPVYSPDGGLLLFEVWRQRDLASRTRLGLFVVAADGSALPHLLVPGDAGAAQFSPDGGQVFFLLRRPDGGRDLCRVNADGTGRTRLTDGRSDVTGFALSPQALKH